MTDTLFLVRALNFDPVAQHLAKSLSEATGENVVFVCDESRGSTDTGDYDKVSLTTERLEAFGLKNVPENWGWLWGDACYYAALAQFPGFDYYCLIESDVFLSLPAAKGFVARLNEQDEDVLAAQLGPMKKVTRFSRTLDDLGLDPSWGCLFPVSRVHRTVIPTMLDLRKRQCDLVNTKLNDEAILGGAVQEGQYNFKALDVIMPDLFSLYGFDTNPPYLFEALIKQDKIKHVYHPVVQFETVMERLDNRYKKYNRHRLRMILRAAEPEMLVQIEKALTRE